MTFDIAPWFATMVAAVGMGPWVAANLGEPKFADAIIFTVIFALSPSLLAEIAGRAARQFRSSIAERVLIHFCYVSALATAAALGFGRLPALVAARFPDSPESLQLAASLGPAMLAAITTIYSEQRAFALVRHYEPPRAGDRIRLAILPLLIPMLVTGAFDICNMSQRFRILYESYALVQAGALALLAFLMLALFPRLVFIAIRTVKMPRGPLLDSFESVASKMNIRVRDFRIAITGDSVANAALLGGFGARRVILTDRILREHPPDELVAVVGHELGHARGGHLRIFALFLGALAAWIINIPPQWIEPLGEWGGLAAALVFLFIILRFGLGPIARLCEHEADLYGSSVAGAIEPIGRSLERISGPARREVTSWRHPSVRARVEFLQKAALNPAIAARPRRILRTVELVAAVLFLSGIGYASWNVLQDLPRERAMAALRSSDFAKAEAIIAEHPGPAMEPIGKLAHALARTGGAGDVSLRERAQAAFQRGKTSDAALFGRLAALRSGKATDEWFASVVEALNEGDSAYVERALAGPASFLSRDSYVGPAIRRALESIATKTASEPAKKSGRAGI